MLEASSEKRALKAVQDFHAETGAGATGSSNNWRLPFPEQPILICYLASTRLLSVFINICAGNKLTYPYYIDRTVKKQLIAWLWEFKQN